MRIEFSRSAVRFLNELDEVSKSRIREKILILQKSLEERQVLPFDELDIKKLKGEWKGFFRIRVGRIRIVFKVQVDLDELLIYKIDFRQNIYDR